MELLSFFETNLAIVALSDVMKITEMKSRQRSEADLMDSSVDQAEPIDTDRVKGREREKEKGSREKQR